MSPTAVPRIGTLKVTASRALVENDSAAAGGLSFYGAAFILSGDWR
jgi:hypothetical protein